MNRTDFTKNILGPLLGLLLCFQVAGAADQRDALIESMESRLSAVMQLKLDGAVGENRLALLEARGNLSGEGRALVAAENRDRMAHYQIIARQLRVPVSTVQQRRAEQIRGNSPRGIWLQSEDGRWYRSND